MSIFKNLAEAIVEVNEHLQNYRVINAFVVKDKNEGTHPYCPIYILKGRGKFGAEFEKLINDASYEVIAVFATIR